MKLRSHDRYAYSPLRGRPNYTWPDGKRLAVYFALNLEHFAYGEGLGAELSPGGPQPDILNFAWRDYGNRVVGQGRGRAGWVRGSLTAMSRPIFWRREAIAICSTGAWTISRSGSIAAAE